MTKKEIRTIDRFMMIASLVNPLTALPQLYSIVMMGDRGGYLSPPG